MPEEVEKSEEYGVVYIAAPALVLDDAKPKKNKVYFTQTDDKTVVVQASVINLDLETFMKEEVLAKGYKLVIQSGGPVNPPPYPPK